jgi:hypothetical protein
MKPMIILRCQPENPQRPTLILGRLVRVRRPQQPLHIEIPALDPNLRCPFDFIEDDAAAVCGWDDDGGIVGGGAWAGIGFEFAVEEFVEVFEFFDGEEDFWHVELVEVYESFDLLGWEGVIEFSTLFDAQWTQELLDCLSERGWDGSETLFLFHGTAFQAFVEEADPKSDIDIHSFFLDLTCLTVLDEDISWIGA